jgi:hypothetical protein
MFRFSFWQAIYYYEPTASKYPNPNFLLGRFVGIAWNHGDALTYRIWTCPDGNWEKGVELIRNIVRPRKETSAEPYSDEVPYGDLTLKSRITKMKDRKRKRNAPTSPIPEPLDEPEDHDPIRLVHFAPTPQIIETSKGLEEQGGERGAMHYNRSRQQEIKKSTIQHR